MLLKFNSAALTKTSTLWALFTATILITLSFPLVSRLWDLTLIDAISSPNLVREVMAGMTVGQKVAHAWVTATLDVAYPIVYGGLFAGVALRFFPVNGRYLSIPALLVIPVDLAEGIVQVLALTETIDWLMLKAFLTPLKMILFLTAFAISLTGWSKWLYFRLKKA